MSPAWFRALASGGRVWAFTDQLVSSLANVVAAILVAAKLSPEEFGQFGVLFSICVLVLSVGRAWTSDPLTVRFAGRSSRALTHEARSVASLALVAGGLAGIGIVATEALISRQLTAPVVVLAVALPAAFLQDLLRITMIVIGRPLAAVLNDAIWLAVTVTSLALVGGGLTVASAIVCWGAGAVVSASVGWFQLHMGQLRGFRRWIRAHHDLSWRYTLEMLSQAAFGYMLVTFIGVLAGLAAAGALRGAEILLGPLTVLFAAVVLSAVPALVALRHDRRVVYRYSVALSGLFIVVWAVTGLALLFIPDSIGVRLLGQSWESAASVLPWMIVSWLAIVVAGGPAVGFRALGLARQSVAIRLVTFVVAVVVVGPVAWIGGLTPAIAGLAIVSGLSTVWWWVVWRSACRPDDASDTLRSAPTDANTSAGTTR